MQMQTLKSWQYFDKIVSIKKRKTVAGNKENDCQMNATSKLSAETQNMKQILLEQRKICWQLG